MGMGTLPTAMCTMISKPQREEEKRKLLYWRITKKSRSGASGSARPRDSHAVTGASVAQPLPPLLWKIGFMVRLQQLKTPASFLLPGPGNPQTQRTFR
ncbi:hypothetical protein P7K49_035589, partial [Saguinus oedipus]